MASKVIKKDKLEESLKLEEQFDMAPKPEMEKARKVLSAEEMASRSKVKSILEEARKDAAKILDHAKSVYLKVEQKIKEAKEKGYEQGRAEGHAEITQKLVAWEKDKQEYLKQLEGEALDLVYEIAHKVLGEGLKKDDDLFLSMIRQSLHAAMGSELIIYLNPEDYQRLKERQSALQQGLQAIQTIQLRPSENVAPNGCVIESEIGTIDANFDVQMEAIKKALGGHS
ncbi:MAG: hypothetical protein H7A33_00870 [Deltaproteobacteria bacterium]|nr:hypothetical protein [Deltaproteobacteria bacterium]